MHLLNTNLRGKNFKKKITILKIKLKNYLGVVIDKNVNNHCNLNYNAIIQQVNKKFNMWLMRDLSLNGRVLLSKAEGMSRSVYVSLSLAMPPAVCKNLDKILFNFIWRRDKKSADLRKHKLCLRQCIGSVL